MRASRLVVLGAAAVVLSACGAEANLRDCAGASCDEGQDAGFALVDLAPGEDGRYVIDFDGTRVGGQADFALRLRNPGREPLTIQMKGATAPFEAPGEVVIAGGSDGELLIRFRPTAPGRVERELQLVGGGGTVRILAVGNAVGSAAFSCDASVDFGAVIGQQVVTRTVTCSNDGTDPVLAVAEASGIGFSVAETAAVELVPGTSSTWTVAFQAPSFGPAAGSLVLRDEAGGLLAEVELAAVAEAAELPLGCTPSSLDFGPTVVGMPGHLSFTCTNEGGEVLSIDTVTSSDPAFLATVAGSTTIAPGEQLEVAVTFDPAAGGAANGIIQVGNADGSVLVPVAGLGLGLAPCQLETTPTSLRFGQLAPGIAADLDVVLRNTGPEACLIWNLGVGSGSFSIPAAQPADFTLAAGEELRIPVHYAPGPNAGVELGAITFLISNPAAAEQSVQLRGGGSESCLLLERGDIQFGNVRPDCSSEDRSVDVYNRCETPVAVSAIDLVSDEPGLVLFPWSVNTPTVVRPGRTWGLGLLEFRPTAPTEAHAALMVQVDGSSEPIQLPIRAVSSTARTVERFEPGAPGRAEKVDVLLVIENSAAAGPVQQFLANHRQEFMQYAASFGADWQLGVISTGSNAAQTCASGAEEGRLFPVDGSSPRILRPDTPALDTAWRTAVNVGTCATEAKSLEAMARAVDLGALSDDPSTSIPNDGNRGFFRLDAALHVLVVTSGGDGSDASFDKIYVNNMLLTRRWLRDGLLEVSVLTTGTGSSQLDPRLANLVEDTRGQLFDGSSLSNSMLESIGEKLFSMDPVFPLRGRPEDLDANGLILDDPEAPEMSVTVGGVRLPGWTSPRPWVTWYDGTQLMIASGSRLDAAAAVEVSYKNRCD